PASFAFRIRTPSQERSAKPTLSRLVDPPRVRCQMMPPKPVAVAPASPPQAAEPTRPAPNLDAAARLADVGRLEEAVRLCEFCLRETGPSAAVYFLLGVIHDARGDGDTAVRYYRKAQYLEPEHSESLLHLALAQERQGDLAGARRLRERARRGACRGD